MGKSFMELKIGDTLPGNIKIKGFGGQSEKVYVYISEFNNIGWEEDGVDEEIQCKVHAKISLLSQQVSDKLPEDTIYDLIYRVAVAAYNALCSNSVDEALEYFIPVEKIIKKTRTADELTVYYISSALLFSISFSLILYLLSLIFTEKYFFYSAIAGSFGALFSIISRSDKLTINTITKNLYIHLQVTIKIILGLFSGVLCLLGAKANIILGVFNEDIYAIILFCTMAGFSERFIPDFMSNLEKINSSKKN